jgi:septal ring factor EnvC (AmiA/AmiB activator)
VNVSAIVTAIVSVALCAGAVAAADQSERLKEVEKRIEQTEAEAKSIQAKTDDALGEIDRLDRSISDRERRVASLAADIKSARARREEAERRITELDEELPRLRASFLERSRGLYRLTHRGLGPVVFAAPRQWVETLRYRHNLQAVLAHDRELVVAMRDNRVEAETARSEAAASAAALDASRKENERELGLLRAERGKKQKLVASLRGEGEEHARRIEELKASAQKLRDLIDQEEASKEKPFEQPPGSATAKMTSPLSVPGEQLVVARNGVEIRVASGTPIHAVKAGRVVFAGWFTGYGKMVILDHGDHLYSIYGYASDIAVEQGQVVEGGDTVASVGTTGPVERPSLYFEIRDHGTARDPAQYIPALARK